MEIKINDDVKVVVSSSDFFGMLGRVLYKNTSMTSTVRLYQSPDIPVVIHDEFLEVVKSNESELEEEKKNDN